MRIRKYVAVFLSLLLMAAASDILPAVKIYAISAPVLTTVSQVTKSSSLNVQGTAQAESKITISGGAKTIISTVGSTGNFSISVTLNQNCLNTICVTATDKSGATSSSTYLTVLQDSQKPDTPVILTNFQTTYYTSIVISGTAEADTIVTITGAVSDTGAFSVPVTLRKNTVNTLRVQCTDAAGNLSSAAAVAITQKPDPALDTTPPNRPTISTPAQYTASKSITLTGKAGSKVAVSGGYGYGSYIGTADNNGKYSIPVFRNELIESDAQVIKPFLESISNAKKLIIDIRGNGDGDTGYWSDNIVSMLAKKDYCASNYLLFRGGSFCEPFVKCALGQYYDSLMPIDMLPELSNLPTEVKTDFKYFATQKMDFKPQNPVDFSGKIYLLVDGVVFSSAEAFAEFCKETEFATIVGRAHRRRWSWV